MPRLLLALLAAITCMVMAAPASAATGSWSGGSSWTTGGVTDDAFAQSPMADEELAAVHGTGFGSSSFTKGDFMKSVASDHSQSYGSQTAGGLSVQLDNWMNDVAAPIIAANLTST